MRRMFSRRSLHIFHLILEEWIYGTHTHNFYELILVNSGNGRHILNNVTLKFKSGDVFLLTPKDNHSFELDCKTDFTYIKFTEHIFIEKEFNSYKQPLDIDELLKVLNSANLGPQSIIKIPKDTKNIFQLSDMLHEEYIDEVNNSRQLILELFGSILMILNRNIKVRYPELISGKFIEKDKLEEVLLYVRQNIADNSKLSIKNISKEFHISPNYVSVYVKKHTGMNLQKMIIETRLIRAEQLLLNSSRTIGQISEDLGFNDASHMNKTFQKFRQKKPSDYRSN